jgi:Lecithin:cholesterol acyltransferase
VPDSFSDVVVMLPGITGSVLMKDGKEVWATTPGAVLRGLFSRGRSVQGLTLEADPIDVDDLDDGVTVGGLVQDAHVIPGLWSIDGYTKAGRTVCQSLGLTAGENYFEFAYDWRRDNRVAARRLQRESHGWLAAARQRGAADPKLVLVGHSMGGLVSRYFIECLEGWKVTRQLITFGTPYRGSLNAVNFLANGFHKGLGPLSIDLSGVLRSFTSVYQLLPIYPCFDPGDGTLKRTTETQIPHVDKAKAEAAMAFHHEIRDAVERNGKDPQYQDARYLIHPVVGNAQPTHQSARAAGDEVKLLRSYEGTDDKGDGTVPRVSSTPLEVTDEAGAMYSNERHGSLQNADPVLNQLAGVATARALRTDRFKAVAGTALAVELEETYLDTEPITVRVTPAEPLGEPLRVVIQDAETGAEVARQPLAGASDATLATELPPLPSRVYRLTVEGDPGADPVHDLFTVVPEKPEAD